MNEKVIGPYAYQFSRGYRGPLDRSAFMELPDFESEITRNATNLYRGAVVSVERDDELMTPMIVEKTVADHGTAYASYMLTSSYIQHLQYEVSYHTGTDPNTLYMVVADSEYENAVAWGQISYMSWGDDPSEWIPYPGGMGTDISEQKDLWGTYYTEGGDNVPSLQCNYTYCEHAEKRLADLESRKGGLKYAPFEDGKPFDFTGAAVSVSYIRGITRETGNEVTLMFAYAHISGMQLGDEAHVLLYNDSYNGGQPLSVAIAVDGNIDVLLSVPYENRMPLAYHGMMEVNMVRGEYEGRISAFINASTMTDECHGTPNAVYHNAAAIVPISTEPRKKPLTKASVSDVNLTSEEPGPVVEEDPEIPIVKRIVLWGQIVGDIKKQMDLWGDYNDKTARTHPWALSNVYSKLSDIHGRITEIERRMTGFRDFRNTSSPNVAIDPALGRTHVFNIKYLPDSDPTPNEYHIGIGNKTHASIEEWLDEWPGHEVHCMIYNHINEECTVMFGMSSLGYDEEGYYFVVNHDAAPKIPAFKKYTDRFGNETDHPGCLEVKMISGVHPETGRRVVIVEYKKFNTENA